MRWHPYPNPVRPFLNPSLSPSPNQELYSFALARLFDISPTEVRVRVWGRGAETLILTVSLSLALTLTLTLAPTPALTHTLKPAQAQAILAGRRGVARLATAEEILSPNP